MTYDEKMQKLETLLRDGPVYWANGKSINREDIDHVPSETKARGGLSVVAPRVREHLMSLLSIPESAFEPTGGKDDWYLYVNL